MRRPPAAELVASVSSGSTGTPSAASSSARAAFTPWVTSPTATEVAATPCPTRQGVASG